MDSARGLFLLSPSYPHDYPLFIFAVHLIPTHNVAYGTQNRYNLFTQGQHWLLEFSSRKSCSGANLQAVEALDLKCLGLFLFTKEKFPSKK